MILMRAMIASMYVCICNGHRDGDIREAAKTGLRCAVKIYRHLGKPPRCGRCLSFAKEVIAEVHGSSEAEEAVPAATRLAS